MAGAVAVLVIPPVVGGPDAPDQTQLVAFGAGELAGRNNRAVIQNDRGLAGPGPGGQDIVLVASFDDQLEKIPVDVGKVVVHEPDQADGRRLGIVRDAVPPLDIIPVAGAYPADRVGGIAGGNVFLSAEQGVIAQALTDDVFRPVGRNMPVVVVADLSEVLVGPSVPVGLACRGFEAAVPAVGTTEDVQRIRPGFGRRGRKKDLVDGFGMGLGTIVPHFGPGISGLADKGEKHQGI